MLIETSSLKNTVQKKKPKSHMFSISLEKIKCNEKRFHRAGEVDQWVKCLMCKHEQPSLDPQDIYVRVHIFVVPTPAQGSR